MSGQPTVSIWHGSSDNTVVPSNGRDMAYGSQLEVSTSTRIEDVGIHQRRRSKALYTTVSSVQALLALKSRDKAATCRAVPPSPA